jgi:F-type H+-transporting ATPase subunit epsilon
MVTSIDKDNNQLLPIKDVLKAHQAAISAKAEKFHLKVYSPFRVYFEGDANSVSAINDTGPFDILAHHHNFLTLLNPCDLVIRSKNYDDEKIRISRGIMQVKADDVVVFLDV